MVDLYPLVSRKITQDESCCDRTALIAALNKPVEARSSKDIELLMPLLQNLKFFKDLDMKPEELSQVSRHLKHECMTDDTVVFWQGDYGDKLYIIIEGKVGVNISKSPK